MTDQSSVLGSGTPTGSCGVCGGAFEQGEHRVSVRVGGAEPFWFHGEGPCYPTGLQHGTRPIREDER